jgi:hypothetical protein
MASWPGRKGPRSTGVNSPADAVWGGGFTMSKRRHDKGGDDRDRRKRRKGGRRRRDRLAGHQFDAGIYTLDFLVWLEAEVDNQTFKTILSSWFAWMAHGVERDEEVGADPAEEIMGLLACYHQVAVLPHPEKEWRFARVIEIVKDLGDGAGGLPDTSNLDN